MEYLFNPTASAWAHRSTRTPPWRKWVVYALDGTTVRVPDSSDNWEQFGGNPGNGIRAGSAYPTVRAVALRAAHSLLVAAVRFGAYATGRSRAGTGQGPMNPVLVEKLGQNDDLEELQVTQHMRASSCKPGTVRMRAIGYQRPGFRPGVLLTSLRDPKKYPAEELVPLYHERSEIELGYDEIKTHLLDRQEALRSRTPQGVRQEVWGILLGVAGLVDPAAGTRADSRASARPA